MVWKCARPINFETYTIRKWQEQKQWRAGNGRTVIVRKNESKERCLARTKRNYFIKFHNVKLNGISSGSCSVGCVDFFGLQVEIGKLVVESCLCVYFQRQNSTEIEHKKKTFSSKAHYPTQQRHGTSLNSMRSNTTHFHLFWSN